jgi:hypothetical protein
MPLSEKQLAANRANALRSTGPRTPEGKARAAQNARKHGFAATTYVVGPIEDQHEVQHLVADAVEFYQPQNSQEHYAVERIALAQQAVLRAARLEASMFTACFIDFVHNGDEGIYTVDFDLNAAPSTTDQDNNVLLAHAFTQYGGGGFGLFLRYQAQAERRYRAAVQEFERLKALRDLSVPHPDLSVPHPDETQMGSFGESHPESQPEQPEALSAPEAEPEVAPPAAAAPPQPRQLAALPPHPSSIPIVHPVRSPLPPPEAAPVPLAGDL